MMHVLPGGFVRIRYYGFLANANRQKQIRKIRELLDAPQPAIPTEESDAHPQDLVGCPQDQRCPHCQEGWMRAVDVAPRPRLGTAAANGFEAVRLDAAVSISKGTGFLKTQRSNHCPHFAFCLPNSGWTTRRGLGIRRAARGEGNLCSCAIRLTTGWHHAGERSRSCEFVRKADES